MASPIVNGGSGEEGSKCPDDLLVNELLVNEGRGRIRIRHRSINFHFCLPKIVSTVSETKRNGRICDEKLA